MISRRDLLAGCAISTVVSAVGVWDAKETLSAPKVRFSKIIDWIKTLPEGMIYDGKLYVFSKKIIQNHDGPIAVYHVKTEKDKITSLHSFRSIWTTTKRNQSENRSKDQWEVLWEERDLVPSQISTKQISTNEIGLREKQDYIVLLPNKRGVVRAKTKLYYSPEK